MSSPPVTERLNAVKYYFSGTLLFTSTSFVATPFLLLKRRIQMGTDSTVFNLVKTEGVRGAFRGGSLSWISGVNRMGYFTIYERAVSIFDRINVSSRLSGYDRAGHTTKSVNNAAAAAVASVVSQAVLTPVSVVTTHLHVHPCNNVSVTQVTRAIVAQHGRWGVLWTGYSSALAQAIPTNMTLFAVYTFTRNHAEDLNLMNSPMSDLLVRLGCSFLGTYAAVMVTSPIDIVRTHRQALVSEGSSYTPYNPGVSSTAAQGHSVVPVPSSLAMLRDIHTRFGWRHLYSGATARLLSSAPFTVAMLIGYDYVKIFSRAVNEE